METFLNQLATNLVPFLIVFCVIPVLLSMLALYLLWRRLNRIAAPDIETLTAYYDQLDVKDEKTRLRRMIRRQSIRAGVVGAITSIGGFYTLPIALPVDVVLSTQIQATMVEFIARHYGNNSESQIERQVRTTLITSGGLRLTESSTRILTRYVTRFVGISFAKLIPFIGAAIGFAVNYAIANATGEAALRYYSTKTVDK